MRFLFWCLYTTEYGAFAVLTVYNYRVDEEPELKSMAAKKKTKKKAKKKVTTKKATKKTIKLAVEELYDVAVLPGVVRPMALGFKTDEIRRIITLPPASPGAEPQQPIGRVSSSLI